MNIYDVSKSAGVSIATVSRVLNDSPLVKASTRNKVLSAIEELGYSPNIFARGLSLGITKTIGILCSDTSDLYTAKAISCFEGLLKANNFDILLSCTASINDEIDKSLNILINKGVQAVILIGSKYIAKDNKNNSAIIEAAKKVPIFLLNGILKGKKKGYGNIYSIYYDDELAMYNLIKKFYERGRKKFAYFHNGYTQSGLRKIEGLKKIKKELKKEEISIDIYYVENQNAVNTILWHIFFEDIKPDTVICSSDFLASYALKFAYKNNLEIPKDFIIIGYDNSIISSLSIPELSSVDSRVEYLCELSISKLIKVLSGIYSEPLTCVEPEFVERESTII